MDHFLFEIVHDMRYFFPANIIHELIFPVALFRADKFHSRTYFKVTPILRTLPFKVNEAGIASIWYTTGDDNSQGRIQGGRTRRAPPLKLEKIWFFGVKSWFFTRNTSKIFAPPSAIEKIWFFWRKIVIFHTKYPKNVRATLCSAQFC